MREECKITSFAMMERWEIRHFYDLSPYKFKIKHFEREFSENIARNLNTISFAEQAVNANCDVFDVVAAYCDLIIQAIPCEFDFNLHLIEAVRQEYVKLDDVLDLTIHIMQNAEISVIDLFLVSINESNLYVRLERILDTLPNPNLLRYYSLFHF